MYELATLKTKKLPELQEIAKKIGIKGIAGLKKLDLVYQIVDFIASKPEEEISSNTQKKQDDKTEIKNSENIKTVSNKVLQIQKTRNNITETKNDHKPHHII